MLSFGLVLMVQVHLTVIVSIFFRDKMSSASAKSPGQKNKLIIDQLYCGLTGKTVSANKKSSEVFTYGDYCPS